MGSDTLLWSEVFCSAMRYSVMVLSILFWYEGLRLRVWVSSCSWAAGSLVRVKGFGFLWVGYHGGTSDS